MSADTARLSRYQILVLVIAWLGWVFDSMDSTIYNLVLTPALCASLLRRPKDHATQKGVFGWFNRHLDGGTRAYRNGANGMIARSARFVLVFVAIAVASTIALTSPISPFRMKPSGVLSGQALCCHRIWGNHARARV